MRLPVTPHRLALLVCLLAAAHAAQAETSPYYIGIAQTFSHESNLLRLRDGQVAPAGRSESDTLSSTALVAGIDQTFGRQRLTGSASLRANRYADNKEFDSSGYSLNLGLDWETIERLSGRLTVGADRNQRADLRDRNGQFILGGNAEDVQRLGAIFRLGMAGPLSLEAGLNYYDLSYQAPEAAYAEFRQTGASFGVRYRLGGATTVGLSVRRANIDYPNLLIGQVDPRDKRRSSGVDLNLTWVPTGSSRLDLTLGQTRMRHDQVSSRDFSGFTGALNWNWKPRRPAAHQHPAGARHGAEQRPGGRPRSARPPTACVYRPTTTSPARSSPASRPRSTGANSTAMASSSAASAAPTRARC